MIDKDMYQKMKNVLEQFLTVMNDERDLCMTFAEVLEAEGAAELKTEVDIRLAAEIAKEK